MGRKKNFTETKLLDMTKKLVLEYGYDGFHLKLLSQHLIGARSTIYHYYPSKEAVVAACMKRTINQVLIKAAEVDERHPMDALKQLLQIYVEESDLHRLLGYANKVQAANSIAVTQDLTHVEQAHHTLQTQLARLFERASGEGSLRTDIPLPAMISLFFSLFTAPNMMNLPLPAWSGLLFEMWFSGARR